MEEQTPLPVSRMQQGPLECRQSQKTPKHPHWREELSVSGVWKNLPHNVAVHGKPTSVFFVRLALPVAWVENWNKILAALPSALDSWVVFEIHCCSDC